MYLYWMQSSMSEQDQVALKKMTLQEIHAGDETSDISLLNKIVRFRDRDSLCWQIVDQCHFFLVSSGIPTETIEVLVKNCLDLVMWNFVS